MVALIRNIKVNYLKGYNTSDNKYPSELAINGLLSAELLRTNPEVVYIRTLHLVQLIYPLWYFLLQSGRKGIENAV